MPLKRYTCKIDGYSIIIPAVETADGMVDHVLNVHSAGKDWKYWMQEHVTIEEVDPTERGVDINRR